MRFGRLPPTGQQTRGTQHDSSNSKKSRGMTPSLAKLLKSQQCALWWGQETKYSSKGKAKYTSVGNCAERADWGGARDHTGQHNAGGDKITAKKRGRKPERHPPCPVPGETCIVPQQIMLRREGDASLAMFTHTRFMCVWTANPAAAPLHISSKRWRIWSQDTAALIRNHEQVRFRVTCKGMNRYNHTLLTLVLTR